MRELIKPFLLLILLIPFATNAYAFTCGDTECVAGEYCMTYGPNNTQRCVPCADLSNNEYPHSDVDDDPAKGTGVCYKICEEIEITNGKWAPEKDKAYYDDACQYKLECNDLEDYCGGFHPDPNDLNGSCISNEQGCEGENGSGFKYWVSGTSELVNKLLTIKNVDN